MIEDIKQEETSHLYIKGKRLVQDIVCTITPSVSKYGFKMYKLEMPGVDKPLEVEYESAVRHIEEMMRFWNERGCELNIQEHSWNNSIVISIVWPNAA